MQSSTSRFLLLSIAVAATFGLIAGAVNANAGVDNVRAVMTTMALAEASVLAIVFSVTVVALQLVVNRYSARLTSISVEDSFFRFTFGAFVLAIALNLLSVYFLPSEIGRLTNGVVGVAFGLGVVCVFALYRFIRMVIRRSSPDELIAVLVERELQPAKYLPETRAAFSELPVHPLRPLYLMTTRAVELGEYHTAEQGIDGFQDILMGTIDYLKTEFDDEEATAYVNGVCEEVLTEYFPPLLNQLYSHEQYDLVKGTVNSVEDVAIYSVDCGFSDVAADAAEGLGDAFDAAPMKWEGNRIRQPVTETLVELTKTTASKYGYGVFPAVVFQLNHNMVLLLRRKAERDVTYSLVDDYYRRDSVEIFEKLLERYAPELEGEDIDWVSPTDGRRWTFPSEAKPLRDYWRNYTSLTREVLRYRASEEEFPFVEGSIDDGWKDFMTSAADSGLDGLATLCCITTIQLAYRVHHFEDGPVGFWTNNLARIRLDYDSGIVDRAFEILISGRQPEGQNIQVHSYDPTIDGEDGGFFARVFFGSDDEVTFEDWVEQFHEDVLERTESLSN